MGETNFGSASAITGSFLSPLRIAFKFAVSCTAAKHTADALTDLATSDTPPKNTVSL